MSDNGVQAEQYAQAAFQALVQKWQILFGEIYESLTSDQDLYANLMDVKRPYEEREKALVDALPNDLPQEMVNLLKLLVQEGDLELLSEMPAALAQASSGQQESVRADIVSAVELSDDDKAALREKLTDEFGKGLVFSFGVNPDLMGGLRVRVGDKLIDTSVASRLAALRESVATVVR